MEVRFRLRPAVTERLRLFLSIPGTVAFYIINQASGAGGEWEESWINFRVP